MVNAQDILLWLNITVLLLTVINLIYTWFSARHRATKENIEELDKVANSLVRRVSVLEERHNKTPTHEDLGKLYEKVNSVGGKIEHVSGALEGIKSQIALISEHLLNGGKK